MNCCSTVYSLWLDYITQTKSIFTICYCVYNKADNTVEEMLKVKVKHKATITNRSITITKGCLDRLFLLVLEDQSLDQAFYRCTTEVWSMVTYKIVLK